MNPTAVLGFSLLVLAASACARPPEPRTVSPDAVATTELSAAVVETDAPKVSKQQHAVEVTSEESAPKDGPRRRPGGGFSGYK